MAGNTRSAPGLGPPLAFWLADIAFRAAGNHMFGVYLLAQLCCGRRPFWTLYLLARAIVGGQQAVLAVLLTMTVVAFSSPGVEFGPLVLARPLWALLLLHSWQFIGQRRRNAWFALVDRGRTVAADDLGRDRAVAAGRPDLRSPPARGRRTLMSFDPLFALLVIAVLALPYLIWLIRADALALPPWPALADLSGRARHWAALLGGLLLAMSGIVRAGGAQLRLVQPQSGGRADHLPAAGRSAGARTSSISLRSLRRCAGSLISRRCSISTTSPAATGIALLLSGLAVIVATGDLVLLRRQRIAAHGLGLRRCSARARGRSRRRCCCHGPSASEVPTSLPATAIARFFGDSFERRTNRPLRAVTGDPQLASLIALDAGAPASVSRRRAGTDAVADGGEIQPVRRRRGMARIRHRRHAACTISRRHFPGLVPEVPRAFEWLVNGRQPLLRIGWAIVRPKAQ